MLDLHSRAAVRAIGFLALLIGTFCTASGGRGWATSPPSDSDPFRGTIICASRGMDTPPDWLASDTGLRDIAADSARDIVSVEPDDEYKRLPSGAVTLDSETPHRPHRDSGRPLADRCRFGVLLARGPPHI